MGEAFTTGVLYAFDWHKAQSGVNVNAQRAALMDKIASAIPVEGRKIALEDGYIVISRDNSFQAYYDDPDDKSIVGGRTAYLLRYYTK